LSSTRINAGKFSTSIFQIASIPNSGYSTHSGRDIAHAKLKERLDRGEDLPQYIKDHPIYYAGPAKTPEGMACGSMGPTTAGRMDSYVELFQSHGQFFQNFRHRTVQVDLYYITFTCLTQFYRNKFARI